MEVENGHVCRYIAETISIQTGIRKDSTQQSKKTVTIMNFLVGLAVLIPFLAILITCGGNTMLTILIVLALIPLGYIFVKFF